MKDTTVEVIAFAGLTVATVGIIALGFVRSHIIYKKDLHQIEIDQNLDMEAIRRTGNAMKNKIDSGEFDGYRSVDSLLHDFNERLAFEKIAIREDN